MESSEEYKKRIEEYKAELITVFYKSQESFEKQLSFITSGTLALSLAFIKDIVDFNTANHKWIINSGWITLAITLIINLASHLLSSKSVEKSIRDIEDEKFEELSESFKNRRIEYINWATLGTLLIGVLLIILFISLNISK